MIKPLRPKRGGFLRPFGCGWFIREFLLGKGPYNSSIIDPNIGAPQADIFYYYKQALRQVTADNKAVIREEKIAKKENRPINHDNIERLVEKYLNRIPYKAQGCRFHSFVVYFSNIQRLGWVEPTDQEEPSQFQDHYPSGPPRKYFRLTKKGRDAGDEEWRNPLKTLYTL